ncbi:MAG: DUF6760 family protein [Crocosphaera sp.]
MLGYPLNQLHEEVAYLAYYFHWQHHSILSLEHEERRQWVEEVAKINRRLNAQSQSGELP